MFNDSDKGRRMHRMMRASSFRPIYPFLLVAAALLALLVFDAPTTEGYDPDWPSALLDIAIISEPAWCGGCTHEEWLPPSRPYSERAVYGIGEVIQVAAEFDLEVEVTGTPQVNFVMGDSTRAADFKRIEKSGFPGRRDGTGRKSSFWELIFEYTVAEGDYNYDGLSFASSTPLVLNGGTITTKKNGKAADLETWLDPQVLERSSHHKVDTVAPQLLNVSIVEPTSPIVRWTGNYRAGDEIVVELEFDEPVYFSKLPHDSENRTHASVGILFGENERKMHDIRGYAVKGYRLNGAKYKPRFMRFKYTIQEGDVDQDGPSLPANAISFNGGVIQDVAGNGVPSLNHAAVEGDSRPVDGNRSIVPVLESLTITSDPGDDRTYHLGDEIEITATFTRNVGTMPKGNGGPHNLREQRVELDIAGQIRTARLSDVDGRKVRFSYTVQRGDLDENGIAVSANQLTWGGSIYEIEDGAEAQRRLLPEWWEQVGVDDLGFFLNAWWWRKGFQDIYGAEGWYGKSLADIYGTNTNAGMSHDAISDDAGHTVSGIPKPANAAPTVAGAIGDVTIVSESGTHEAPLAGVFSDADGDDLTVTGTSSDETVATVSVSADYSTLTVTAKARGTATITATADDGTARVEDTFTVTIKAAPVVASAIADVSELAVDATQEVSLSGVFSDADGDALTISATSSDSTVVQASNTTDPSTGSATAITVIGVNAGTATITVTARDSDGNRVSDTFDVTVPAAEQQQAVELPGPVTGLTVTASGEDSVTVNWSAPESGGTPDGYIVHLRPEGGKQGSGTTKRPGADQTTVGFNSLSSGRTYEVWVRAQNQAGKGERVHGSIILEQQQQQQAVEPPGPVTSLELTADGNAVTVSWSAPETGGAPDNYIVHIKPEDGGKGKTKTPKAKKTQVTFNNLNAGTTYEVWVRAENGAGKGERVHASITLPQAEPPPEESQGDGQQ